LGCIVWRVVTAVSPRRGSTSWLQFIRIGLRRAISLSRPIALVGLRLKM
jgi:hypothetical protein